MKPESVDELVGVWECAALFEVPKSNFIQLIATRPTFPEPIAYLHMGRVWRKSDVEAWKAKYRKVK